MDGLILIDKVEDITSYDVVKQVKRIFHTKKVGHCGTLDPFATGLLVIGINQATKVMSFLEHDFKEYTCKVKLGTTTDTYDLTGKVVSSSNINKISKEQILEVIETFKGKITQTPPIYSSIHVDGKHLYEYARNNEHVEIPTREVVIYDLKLLDYDDESFSLYVKCSRGTYIRSLGVDIAKALNNDGHLCKLRRISIGNIKVENAITFDKLKEGEVNLIDIKDCLSFKQITLNSVGKLRRVYNGQNITLLEEKEDNILIIDGNKAVAIYNLNEDGTYHCVRGLYNEDIRFKRLKELQG